MIISNTPHRLAWQRYVYQTGATDKANLLAWCDGIYDLGLWSNMVCWPLRSAQNFGTGTVVQSLGGLGSYRGTLVNGPTWGAEGVLNSATGYISTSGLFIGPNATVLSVVNTTSGAYDTLFGSLSDGNAKGLRLREDIAAYGDGAYHQLNHSAVGSGAFSFVGASFGSRAIFFSNSSATDLGAISSVLTPSNSLSLMAAVDGTAAQHIVGTMSFSMAVTQEMTDASQIYSLYKSTLGIGLSLP